MAKDKAFDFGENWSDLWMKQSKLFFERAEKNLKELFSGESTVNPEIHMKQIEQWIEMLKAQWGLFELNEQQAGYEAYWRLMSTMCNEASQMMLDQWIKRSRHQDPIKNIRELYELWLNCCNEVYEKTMQTKAYQETYNDYLKAVLQFWKSAIPK